MKILMEVIKNNKRYYEFIFAPGTKSLIDADMFDLLNEEQKKEVIRRESDSAFYRYERLNEN